MYIYLDALPMVIGVRDVSIAMTACCIDALKLESWFPLYVCVH